MVCSIALMPATRTRYRTRERSRSRSTVIVSPSSTDVTVPVHTVQAGPATPARQAPRAAPAAAGVVSSAASAQRRMRRRRTNGPTGRHPTSCGVSFRRRPRRPRALVAPPMAAPLSTLSLRAKRRLLVAARALLLSHARATPPAARAPEAQRRVTFWLASAWGMGGTIRATWSLATWLAAHGYDVEILSSVRDRETPFFGPPPPGVRLVALDDRRPDGAPRGAARLLRQLLVRAGSVLVHPD